MPSSFHDPVTTRFSTVVTFLALSFLHVCGRVHALTGTNHAGLLREMMATNLILVVPTFENLGAYTTVGVNSNVALEEQDEMGCGALTKPSEIDACDNYVPASLNDIYAQHDRYTFFRYPVCPNCQGVIPFDKWLKTSEREIKVPHALLRASPKFE